MGIVSYVFSRIADRVIDLAGLGIGVLGLIIAYSAAAIVVNVIVPTSPALLPSDLLELMYELGTKCLELCFEE